MPRVSTILADAAYDDVRGDGPRHSYLIATTQRSGSHFLAHLLHATGQLGCPFEYLNPDLLLELQRRFGTTDRDATLREVRRRRTSSTGWFGMKAHWTQFDTARKEWKLGQDLIRFDRFIHIERRDRVAQAVSLAIAEQTDRWISLQQPASSEPRYAPLKIHLHRQHVEWENRCWNAFFKDNGIEPYRLVYEDLAAEPLKTLNELLSSFGAAPAQSQPEIPIARQGTGINEDWKGRYERDRKYHPYLRARDAAKAIKQRYDSLRSG